MPDLISFMFLLGKETCCLRTESMFSVPSNMLNERENKKRTKMNYWFFNLNFHVGYKKKLFLCNRDYLLVNGYEIAFNHSHIQNSLGKSVQEYSLTGTHHADQMLQTGQTGGDFWPSLA